MFIYCALENNTTIIDLFKTQRSDVDFIFYDSENNEISF